LGFIGGALVGTGGAPPGGGGAPPGGARVGTGGAPPGGGGAPPGGARVGTGGAPPGGGGAPPGGARDGTGGPGFCCLVGPGTTVGALEGTGLTGTACWRVGTPPGDTALVGIEARVARCCSCPYPLLRRTANSRIAIKCFIISFLLRFLIPEMIFLPPALKT